MCIPTRTHLNYNNDKPWFTSKLRQLHQAKEDAYRKGDIVLYKQAKYTLENKIRVAKRNYSGKLRNKISSCDSASVWKGMKDITRFMTPENRREHLSTQPLTPPATPLSPTPALKVSEYDVRQAFSKNKRRKAPGPDSVPPAYLKSCPDQLALIFTQIFNRSLELCEVPSLVMSGWRLNPRALRIIHGSGGVGRVIKNAFWLRVGHGGWIR